MAMADSSKTQRRQRLQLQLEGSEMRSLRVPAHRGHMSPSKSSVFPSLQQESLEIPPRQRSPAAPSVWTCASKPTGQCEQADRTGPVQIPAHLSDDVLERARHDFISTDGVQTMDQFVKNMLRSLESAGSTRDGKRSVKISEDTAPSYAAGVMDLFQQIDVHSEGVISWEEVSNYLVDSGMSGGDAATIDNIKTYEPSHVVDQSKHEVPIDKLIYLSQMDTIVCTSSSRNFRLYDPNRCTLKQEVSGHRGNVLSCCYVDSHAQIATAATDTSICMWDSTSLKLRNRMLAKEMQLCLQYDSVSRCLFSGSPDGTLNCWDLQNMCLAEVRKGQHKQAINDLLAIDDINLLASASSDGTIITWDTGALRPKGIFKGHKKGTYSLAYSNDYRCMLSAGLDHEALIWNPYVERVPIFRLKGHTNYLCGVEVIPGTPQIITADVRGTFRLWDMRNFRCVQTFGTGEPGVRDLNSFCVIPPYRRLAAAGTRVLMYDYMDDWNGERVTDTNNIAEALYNPRLGEFYTVSAKGVKTWNASNGSLVKVLRDVTPDEITSVCLDDSNRKLYVGNAAGRVTSHNLHSGALLTKFASHPVDVSCLAVWPGTYNFFSASVDGVVKVQLDERHRRPQLKADFSKYQDGITCLSCSTGLMLLAAGGTDAQVCLYDLKTLKYEHVLNRFDDVVAGLDFLDSRCLLAVADHGGNVTLWRVRPHSDKWLRVFCLKNTRIGPSLTDEDVKFPVPAGIPNLEAASIPLCSVLFCSLEDDDPRRPKPMLYTADAKGFLRCWDISRLCERRKLVDMNLKELFESYRLVQLRLAASSCAAPRQSQARCAGSGEIGFVLDDATNNSPSFLTAPGDHVEDQARDHWTSARKMMRISGTLGALGHEANPTNDEVLLAAEVDGHEEGILSLHLTRRPAGVLTCGRDRKVCAWSRALESHGTLLMMSEEDQFAFPFDAVAERKRKIQEAGRLLKRIGSWYPVQGSNGALPLLNGSRSVSQPLLQTSQSSMLGVSGKDILHRSGSSAKYIGRGNASTGKKVLARSSSKVNKATSKRMTALSQEETAAAGRLAMAMSALGCENMGSFASLASAIQPKAV